MNFTHYSDEAATVAAELVNTLGSTSGREWLPTPEALEEFLGEHGMEPGGRITERDVDEVREVRARLRAVFEAEDADKTARLINDILVHSHALPQVTNHDGGPWHLHFGSPHAKVADRLAGIAAMGLATVISEYGRDRLGICHADRCADVFVDTSRNKSRRYCEESCASRTNVAAYRARHKHKS